MKNYFWDSCVFSAYLRDEKHIYDVPSIEAFLEDAKNGNVKIYCSTLSSAEVLPSQIKNGGTFEEFMSDYEGAVIPHSPDPNIMALSGRLRDLPYKKGTSTKRRLSTADAIILATAIHLRDAYEVDLTAFHTYDGGGKKDLDGNNSIPLLGFETWCEGFNGDHLVVADSVSQLNRCKPVHPSPRLPHVP